MYKDEEISVVVVGTDLTVTDPTGKSYTLHGFGAGKGTLDLDPRIDLTKPIYAQARRLHALDKKSEAVRPSAKHA